MLAVILAGGKGSRLRPYTTTLPKPLMPVGENPILGILLGKLREAGVRTVVLAVNHMAHLIEAYFGRGTEWGLDISYSLENKPLGTVAPLKLIEGLPENFLVLNGDILTDLDFNELFDFHLKNEALVTVATHEREQMIDYGVLEVDKNGRVVGFEEKPANKYLVSMGIYVFNREILSIVPGERPWGFDDLMGEMLNRRLKISTLPHKGYWLDIGRPEDYERANLEYGNFV